MLQKKTGQLSAIAEPPPDILTGKRCENNQGDKRNVDTPEDSGSYDQRNRHVHPEKPLPRKFPFADPPHPARNIQKQCPAKQKCQFDHTQRAALRMLTAASCTNAQDFQMMPDLPEFFLGAEFVLQHLKSG